MAFDVAPHGMVAFVNALSEFARRYGYRGLDPEDLFRIQLEGFRTSVSIAQLQPGSFLAVFVNRSNLGNLWLVVVPDADLGELAGDFRAAMMQVDGVTIVDASNVFP